MDIKNILSKFNFPKKNKRFEIESSKIKSSKKSTTGFTMVLIPNSSEKAKTIEITFDQLMRCFASGVAIAIIMIGLMVSLAVNNHTLKHGDDNTRNTILSLQQENADLKDKVSELSVALNSSESVLNKIESQLSADADAKAKKSEEEMIPDEIPVKGGTSILIQDDTVDVENGERQDGIVFKSLEGSVVVATAAGSVISVDSDPYYGGKVVIDHKNGYITTYRTNALIKVKFGDNVRKNDMIAIMTDDQGLIEYEITLDGVLINPTDLIKQ